MKKLILMIALVAVCGVVQAGESSNDAVQKSATQKSDACQKAEGNELMGFFGRIRNRRIARIEARQAGWNTWALVRAGNCR